MLTPIHRTLHFKLTAAFLLVALVGVLVVSYLANQATAVGLRRFLDADTTEQWREVQEALIDYYAAQGSWAGVETLLASWQPEHGQGSTGLILLDGDEQVVAAAGGQRNRPITVEDADLSLPLAVNGKPVGTLLIRAPGMGNSRAGEQFLTEVNRAILWGGFVAVLLALFLGLLLAHRLTRPLRQLTQATRQMAAGDLQQQVHITTQDELGELATSFNLMTSSLAQAEQQRQQLLADVAHELRTPLSVMRSHLEAMLDGVFALTPENLAVAHEETILLGRLVDDLRTLSLAEAGQLQLNQEKIDLGALVEQTITAFTPLAEAEGVTLTTATAPNLPPITADPARLRQLLGNLLANALRYARQDTNPQVQVRISLQPGFVQVDVADNGPGLSPEAQTHVFDRFWRGDGARSRDQGGSGLGLAICRAIVTAHRGRITVNSTPGHGATFSFTLPL
ncbi:MAG: HAMP domain-containing protein [Chloroflexi bacterium]|nr:HAMP domain-containing protein [Chloroflexota bacterium]